MSLLKKESLASYMINKYNADYSYDVTPIKLQKGLYFLFAFWGGMIRKAKNNKINAELDVSKYDEFLIEPNFEAWTYGPVDVDIYKEFKYENEKFSNKDELVNKLDCDRFTADYIDNLLDRIFVTNDFGLVDLSHEDNSWRDAYNEDSLHIKMNPESIIEEYAERQLE